MQGIEVCVEQHCLSYVHHQFAQVSQLEKSSVWAHKKKKLYYAERL